MNTNRRPDRILPNTPSRSAHQLIASAADNAGAAPVNGPYRPRTTTARHAAV
ncbi:MULTISPECIES: hypothetical protein [unclassified Micromonospora]|uniref:hypothetical protein n=1 Tax=unclassified Micromonospora TaxID=2617518 RepID=UPI00331B6F71